jgi:hypothetical protein
MEELLPIKVDAKLSCGQGRDDEARAMAEDLGVRVRCSA